MQFQDVLSTLILELVKLLVVGVMGGFIGGWIGFKTFQSQKKYETKIQDNLRRRDLYPHTYSRFLMPFFGTFT